MGQENSFPSFTTRGETGSPVQGAQVSHDHLDIKALGRKVAWIVGSGRQQRERQPPSSNRTGPPAATSRTHDCKTPRPRTLLLHLWSSNQQRQQAISLAESTDSHIKRTCSTLHLLTCPHLRDHHSLSEKLSLRAGLKGVRGRQDCR